MEEKTYKLWDIIIKAFGFITTAASIYIGLINFTRQQRAATELEFNRNFWQKQTQIYAEVCRNAGTLAANTTNPATFQKEKQNFLSLYYGDLVLVEDSTVSLAMRELKSYLEEFEPKDPNMVNILKDKVLRLSEACKQSSVTFKRANL